MIWLWGGYPEPVKAGITQNDFLNKYLYRDGEKTPFKPLSVSGQDQWVKEKEIDRTAPFAFTIEDIAQGQRARKSNRRTYYCAVYPDDSFTALEKSFFYKRAALSCYCLPEAAGLRLVPEEALFQGSEAAVRIICTVI